MMNIRLSLIWVMLFLCSTVCQAEPITLDSAKWEALRAGQEYAERPKEKPAEEPDEEEKEEIPEPTTDVDLSIVGYILIGAVGVLLITAIIILVVQSNNSRSVNVQRKDAESIEEAEESLPEVDLTNLYQSQVNQGEWKLALRVKFLMILQKLIDNGNIIWLKQKTNQHYAQEITTPDIKWEFQRVADFFDDVWYGDQVLDESNFQVIRQKFELFLSKLDRS